MKKKAIVLLVAALVMQIEAPVQAAAPTLAETKIETNNGIFKKKRNRGYRPKKGGFLGTGLLRKKNPCGCPNH